MTSPRIRVRFAPSPTGELHVGNARTALFNWLFARGSGGAFILRIEDTDQVRTTPSFEENLLDDLHWLGIDWDEGPGIGGAWGPYRQSERFALHHDCLQKLILNGRVYPCYCTEAELEAERTDLIVRRMMPRYMGKCRCLTEPERRRLEAEGHVPVWRFRIEEGPIRFDDLIRGSMAFQGEAIGDSVIVRSSGMPSYNFAVVVDDHFMEITHVIRGEDHLSNTATQILLYRALDWEPPLFAHHALITGADHAKLSKRHGAVSVREFRRRGILPEVLLNYLALLGGSFSGVQEIRTAHELCRLFSLNRTGRGGAVFDEEKLLWLNGAYIRRYETEILAEKLIPFVRAAGYDALLRERNRLEGIVAAVRNNLVTLADIGGFLDLFADERYRMGEDAAAIIRGAETGKALRILHDELFLLTRNCRGDSGTAPSEVAMNQTIFRNLIHAVSEKSGLRGKKLYMPIRAAVTGRLHGPELDRVFALLGTDSLLKRLERALAHGSQPAHTNLQEEP